MDPLGKGTRLQAPDPAGNTPVPPDSRTPAQLPRRILFFLAVTAAAGLPVGVALGLVITAGAPVIWRSEAGGRASAATGPHVGFAVGLAAGTLFGMAVAGMFVASRALLARAPGMDLALVPGETVLRAGLANHFAGRAPAGGKLTLTGQRLAFRTHAHSTRPERLDLPLSEIAEVEPFRVSGLAPTGIAVRSRSGSEERFAVEDRNGWLQAIEGARAVLE